MCRPQTHGPRRPLVLLTTAALLAGAAQAQADAPTAPPDILAAARAAIAQNSILKTGAVGFHNDRRLFTELPAEGAVLVGFDLGLGKFFNLEVIYAYRPIYLTRRGRLSFQNFGLFTDVPRPGNRPLKSKVQRIVRVAARPGYAVGNVTVRSGLLLNGLSVTFMRVNGQNLDPLQTYNGAWVGDRTGGSEATIGGFGAPVIGVFGSQEEDHVKSLGLIYLSQVLPEPGPQPAPVLAERPASAQPTTLIVQQPPPLRELEKATGRHRPAAAEARAKLPPAPRAEPAAPVKQAAPTPARSAGTSLVWLLVLIVGGALVPLLFLLAALCRKRPANSGAGAERIPQVRPAPPGPGTQRRPPPLPPGRNNPSRQGQ
jgi:hypothetical protein